MKTNLLLRLLSFGMLLSGIWLDSSPVSAASTIPVTSTVDSLADDGQCSLREAVIAANTDTAVGGCPAGSGADVIIFAPSLTTPAVFTLALTGANEDNAATGDLDGRP